MSTPERKRIGITQRVVYVDRVDERRDTLDQRWYDFAAEINARLVPVPNNLADPEGYAEALGLEGLILSGGNNVGISGEELLTAKTLADHDVARERDRTEKKLLKWAVNDKKPVIGICRGLQFINAFFGGEAVQVDADVHVAAEHKVRFTIEAWKDPFGEWRDVNSYHRWGIPRDLLAPELRAAALAGDSVEAVEHTAAAVYGLMWHPERYSEFRDCDKRFFKEKLEIR